jgi:hypothetical protein
MARMIWGYPHDLGNLQIYIILYYSRFYIYQWCSLPPSNSKRHLKYVEIYRVCIGVKPTEHLDWVPWRHDGSKKQTKRHLYNEYIYIQKYTLYVYTISLHYTILLIHLHLHIRIRVYELYVYTYMYCIETPSITHLAPALSSRAMAVLAFARRLAVGSTNCRRKPRLPGSRTTTWWISIGI